MTTENWINVAMIIAVIMTAAATLLGPVVAVYVQVRMSQPKPTPDTPAPKSLLRVIWQILDIKRNKIRLVGILISIAIFGTGYALSKHNVDRKSATLIAFGISSYYYWALLILLRSTSRVKQISNAIYDEQSAHNENDLTTERVQ